MNQVFHRQQDSRFVIELILSENRSKLFVSLAPGPEHAAVSDHDLIQEIRKFTASELIDEAVVRDIAKQLRQGHGCELRRVAKSVAPTEPRDGKIVWLVRRYDAKESSGETAGFVDFFYLGLFENVKKGQKIARVYQPKVGSSGKDALGKEIPPRAAKPFSFDTNGTIALELGADPAEGYDTLIANANG